MELIVVELVVAVPVGLFERLQDLGCLCHVLRFWFMCISIYIYIYTRTHVWVYYICMHIYIYMCIHMYTYIVAYVLSCCVSLLLWLSVSSMYLSPVPQTSRQTEGQTHGRT